MFFDVHCHLQDTRYGSTVSSVVSRAHKSGVRYMVCCATAPNDWNAVLTLAQKYPSIIPAIGVHPWFIDTIPADWEEQLDELVQKERVGIGECGLDFAITHYDRKKQEHVFRRQLYMAKKYNRPVNMHCRKAWEPFVAILKEIAPFPAGALVHSYSGSPAFVKPLEQLGISISFSGSLTRPNAKKGPLALKECAQHSILLETDSPDILPSGIEEKPPLNEPAHITYIAQRMADLLDCSLEEVASLTYNNAQQLFKGLL